MLEEFKQYASVPSGDDARDGLLTALLQAALVKVQEYADESCVPCRCMMQATVQPSRRMALYMRGGVIDSVTDMATGAPVAYGTSGNPSGTPGFAEVLTDLPAGRDIQVIYDTAPDPAALLRLKATVLRYATALYDGAAQDELGAILNAVL